MPSHIPDWSILRKGKKEEMETPPEGWRIDAVYKDMPKSSEESDLDVGV